METWNKYEKNLGEFEGNKLFAFAGFNFRDSKLKKKFEVISLDNGEGSFWIPLFKVGGANLTMDKARLHKGNVDIRYSKVEGTYWLTFC